jgi:hypothetical protein
MRPSNPPGNVTLFKNLQSVATTPQLLAARNGFGLASADSALSNCLRLLARLDPTSRVLIGLGVCRFAF